jgi:hypothetical protein
MNLKQRCAGGAVIADGMPKLLHNEPDKSAFKPTAFLLKCSTMLSRSRTGDRGYLLKISSLREIMAG